MEWMTAMQKAISYMEDNLLEDISSEDVSSHVYISSYYFQKGFKLLSGHTISEYIRNRRLYLAALDLLDDNNKIIDIAYKYKYETPESFSKAFLRFHGMSPSNVKAHRAQIQTFHPLIIKLSVEGGNKMNVKFEEMNEFKVIGVGRYFEHETAQMNIPKFWWEYHGGLVKESVEQLGECNIGTYGISMDMAWEKKDFRYMIAGDYTGDTVPKGLEVINIPSHTWAKFKAVGPLPGSIQTLNDKIYREWLPNNPDYEICDGFCIEMYTCGDVSATDYESEIWIPVKRK